jgi:hypothetical protein
MKFSKKTLYPLWMLFALIFIGMLSVIITATIDQNIFEAVGNMWPNWWFKASLLDLYFAFLTLFVWVAYKEIHLWRKLVWFASFMLLGSLAISAYMLTELYRLRVGDTVETLLTRRNG